MKLSEILEALKDKEIDGGVIDAVKALDQSAEVASLKSDLETEQGKSAGILADKKKYKERAESAEGKLDDIEKSKLPEKERHEREMEELKTRLEGEQKQREADKAEFAKTQREAALADITGSIRWADGIPQSTAKMIVKNDLADVEDLGDGAKVEEVLKAVKESHKSFIAADAPGGSGGKGGSGGDKSGGGGEASSIADNQKEIWG